MGKLAVAAVDEHTELNAARTAVIEQRVQRRSRRPAGVEHVVHQNDVLVLDVEFHFAGRHLGTMADRGKVVAIEGDVERSDRHFGLLDAAQDLGQPLRQRYSATLDADETEVGDAIVLLDNLVRQANQGALDFGGGKDLRFLAQVRRTCRRNCHAVRIIRKAQAAGNFVRTPCDAAHAGR